MKIPATPWAVISTVVPTTRLPVRPDQLGQPFAVPDRLHPQAGASGVGGGARFVHRGAAYAVKGQAQSLMALQDDEGRAAGPTFEYVAPEDRNTVVTPCGEIVFPLFLDGGCSPAVSQGHE